MNIIPGTKEYKFCTTLADKGFSNKDIKVLMKWINEDESLFELFNLEEDSIQDIRECIDKTKDERQELKKLHKEIEKTEKEVKKLRKTGWL